MNEKKLQREMYKFRGSFYLFELNHNFNFIKHPEYLNIKLLYELLVSIDFKILLESSHLHYKILKYNRILDKILKSSLIKLPFNDYVNS
jgi:hypothetical protein